MTPSIVTKQFPIVSPAPVSSLFVYQTWTRDTWRAAGGPELPTEDLTKPFKSWKADDATGDPSDTWLYRALDPNGLPKTYQIKDMTVAEAQTLNLPGLAKYPSWTVLPTNATRGGQPTSAAYFSTQDQANTLMAEINAAAGAVVCTGLIDQGQDGEVGNAWDPFVYPADELRRQFVFLFKAPSNATTFAEANAAGVNILPMLQYVGLLLAQKWHDGIGSPGNWNVAGAAPVWISTTPKQPGVNTHGMRPQPVRDLLPTESLIIGGGLPPIVELVNSALPPAVIGTGPAGSDGYGAADRTLLQEIHQKVIGS